MRLPKTTPQDPVKDLRRANLGTRNGQSVLDEEKVRRGRRLYADGDHTQAEIGRILGVSRQAVHDFLSYRTWRHVDPHLDEQ